MAKPWRKHLTPDEEQTLAVIEIAKADYTRLRQQRVKIINAANERADAARQSAAAPRER